MLLLTFFKNNFESLNKLSSEIPEKLETITWKHCQMKIHERENCNWIEIVIKRL